MQLEPFRLERYFARHEFSAPYLLCASDCESMELRDLLARHADLFDWRRPKAGPIAFPALLKGRVHEFCADLVERSGVLLLPGTLYGAGLNCFRVGYGRKNVPAALLKFEEALRLPGLGGVGARG